MTYPASPRDAATNRVRPDSAQFWAGVVATAIVAALIALVGILICRWTLSIPILAPAGEGAWGNAHTAEYALLAGLVAIIAGGLLYLLVLGTPQPNMFFGWIIGLATLAAVVYPFSTSAPLQQKAATAIVDLVLGIAIMSLLTAVAARAVRRPATPVDGYRLDEGHRPDDGYVPEPRGSYEPRGHQPTQPIDEPHGPGPRRY